MTRKKAGKQATRTGGKRATGQKAPAKSKALSGASAGLLPSGYGELLEDLKTRVRAAQLKSAVAANRELIQLYWDIGRLIVERQEHEGWGKAVIERLADDVQRAFPGLGGFSRTNVFRMRSFFLAYAPAVLIVPQAVGQSTGKKVAQPVRQFGIGKNPTACGTIRGSGVAPAVCGYSLGTQHRPHRKSQRPRCPPVVRVQDH